MSNPYLYLSMILNTLPALLSTVSSITAQAPAPRPTYAAFHASDVTTAARRTAEVAAAHPSWPQSRVRSLVAREMNIGTHQLRYLLRKASDL